MSTSTATVGAHAGAGDTIATRAPSRWSLRGETRLTPAFALTYVAAGLLIAEAAVGLMFVFGGWPGRTVSNETGTTTVPTGVARSFELKAFASGFVGVGGSINGLRDPTLQVGWGDTVTIRLVDGEAQTHDLHVDGVNAQSSNVAGVGSTTNLTFRATSEGTFAYYCTIPGHREMGMQGTFVVGEPSGPQIGPELPLTVARIAHDPAAIPPPIERNFSTTVNVYIEAKEVTAEVEPGVSYTYWTYNGTVPGPFVRVRMGDTVVVHFSNDANSTMNHSIDFHAATGPGGGAAALQTPPGQTKVVTFLAMMPGLYVYHCGTPNIPTHIANGMFGLILVEPPGGLPAVSHEYYLVQSELYTQYPIHTPGNQVFSGASLLANDPTYVVFNGMYDALTGTHALHVAVNDSVRVFFGDAGPDDFSAFHLIGMMFNLTWANGDLTDPPLHDLQTVAVAPGSAATVQVTAAFPGNYSFVDHQIANAIDKGALAVLNVTGWANTSIFHRGLPPVGTAVPAGGSAVAATRPGRPER